MTRQERVDLHKKAERKQVGTGVPTVNEMTEGVTKLRNVSGKGLIEYSVYNNKLHEKKLNLAGKNITKLTDSTGGSVSNTLNDTTVSVKDDLAALASKINEIIEKIN